MWCKLIAAICISSTLQVCSYSQATADISSTDRRIDYPTDAVATHGELKQLIKDVLETNFPYWFRSGHSQAAFDVFLLLPGNPADSRIVLSLTEKKYGKVTKWSDNLFPVESPPPRGGWPRGDGWKSPIRDQLELLISKNRAEIIRELVNIPVGTGADIVDLPSVLPAGGGGLFPVTLRLRWPRTNEATLRYNWFWIDVDSTDPTTAQPRPLYLRSTYTQLVPSGATQPVGIQVMVIDYYDAIMQGKWNRLSADQPKMVDLKAKLFYWKGLDPNVMGPTPQAP